MSVFGAFLAAFLVGTSDFLSRLNRDAFRPLHIAVVVMGGGAVFLYSLLHFVLGYSLSDIPSHLWIVGAIGGLINFLAVLSHYNGLRRGPVSVVSPLASMSTLFLVTEWFLVGASFSPLTLVGVGLAVGGAILVGYKKNKIEDEKDYTAEYILITAFLGLLAGLGFASRTFLIQYFMTDLHIIASLFLVRLFAFSCGISWSIFELFKNKESLRDSFKNVKPINSCIVILQSMLESSGILLLIYISVGDYKVIGPAIFSFFCVVAILWSVFFLGEKLNRKRIMGIMVLLFGVVIMQISLNG